MDTVAQKLKDARLMASLSMSELAKLADVSISTVSRAESGKIVPTANTYLALLLAAGFTDRGDRIVPLSRPSATWAARWLVGDLPDQPHQTDLWLTPWQRVGLVSDDCEVLDYEGLLFRAGRCASLVDRPGIVTVLAADLAPQAAARLSEAGIDYAITGDEALARLGAPLVPTWPVVYVADVRAALTALGLTPALPGDWSPHRVSFLPFDGYSEAGRAQTDDGLWWASPVQAVIDGYGGYGRMTEQAEAVVGAWDAA